MAVIETWFHQDLQEPVKVNYLNGNLFSNNGNGNRIGVVLTNNGEDLASISGTVSGYVVTADGSTVPCTGSKSGNRASILIPAAAYQPGSIFITVFVTDGTTVTTIGAVCTTVMRSRTNAQVDPGSAVTDWTQTINAAMQSVETAAANLGGIVAVPYASITFPVPLGKYTYYNNNLYRCITPIASSESFTAAHWTQVRLGDDVSDLKSALIKEYQWPFTPTAKLSNGANLWMCDAIKDLKLYGAENLSELGFRTLVFNKASVNLTQFLICDSSWNNYCGCYYTSLLPTTGYYLIKLDEVSGSGVTGEMLIDCALFAEHMPSLSNQSYAGYGISESCYKYNPIDSNNIYNNLTSLDNKVYNLNNYNYPFRKESSLIVDGVKKTWLTQAIKSLEIYNAENETGLFFQTISFNNNNITQIVISKYSSSDYACGCYYETALPTTGYYTIVLDELANSGITGKMVIDCAIFNENLPRYGSRDYAGFGIDEGCFKYHSILQQRVSALENEGFGLYGGKVLSTFGDSVTEMGYWQDYVKNYFGFSIHNNVGKGGACVSSKNGTLGTTSNYCLSNENVVEKISTGSDVVIVMAGTNDYLNSVPLGDFSEPYNRDTFKGAYSLMIQRIISRLPQKLVIFMTQHSGMGNGDNTDTTSYPVNDLGLSVADYAKAEREVFEHFGVKWIDMFTQDGITPFNRSKYLATDGVHPKWPAYALSNVAITALKNFAPYYK